MPDNHPLRIGGRPPAPVLNIGHRGARAFAPENTLESFAKAAALGCQMFELDVHLTRDGELVVVHDDTLDRCSDAAAKFPARKPWFVSDFTAAEIRTLDAGSWYVRQLGLLAPARQDFLQGLTDAEIAEFVPSADRAHYSSSRVRHPTLAEALECGRRHGMLVNVEIKSLPRMYRGIAGKVADLLMSMEMQRQVIVSSFDHVVLAEMRRLCPDTALGALTCDRIHRPADYLRALGADALNPAGEAVGVGSADRRIDRDTVRECRAAGLGVNVWTVNDPARLQALVQAGVTGIFCDYPNRLRTVLAGK